MLERGILDLQEKASVRHNFGEDALHLWHTLPKGEEYLLKALGMLFAQVLNDVSEVVPRPREAFARPGFRLTACCFGREV